MVSFLNEVEYLRDVWEIPDKIIAFGVGQYRPNKFTDFMMKWISGNMGGKRVHFYGMGLAMMRKYVPMLERAGVIVTVDSTKWTRAVNEDLKKKYGVACRKNTRHIFFLEYINEISKFCEVEY